MPVEGLRTRVETEENLFDGQRVFVLGPQEAGDLGVGGWMTAWILELLMRRVTSGLVVLAVERK